MSRFQEILKEYRTFLEDVSEEAARLSAIYEKHMACRKGCSDCCTDLSLLPLEWYALKAEVKAHSPSPERREESCSLLKNDACAFYKYRPLICRTHGLPLLYLIEEYDLEGRLTASEEPEWQISWCDLNFKDVGEDDMEDVFQPEDVLNMEEWNIRLRALNKEFIETEEGRAFEENTRLSLAAIFN